MHFRQIPLLIILCIYNSYGLFAFDKNKDSTGLFYIVHKPEVKSEHPAVLILLHGYGGTEQNLYNMAVTYLPKDLLIVSARGPITLSEGSYAWCHVSVVKGERIMNADEAEESRKLISNMINEVNAKYHTDTQRVYLLGFSQGSRMSYAVGLTEPEKIKGVAILSGSLSEEVKPMVATEKKLKHTSWFISHGTYDDVISLEKAQKSRDFLIQKGIRPEYHEYPMGHEIQPKVIEDLKNWIAKMET
ncbi:MAG: dienelactone hydrolase family protein, partial [Bacteroidota bacterium]